MSSSLRMDNHTFYDVEAQTASENSVGVEVGGARGVAVLVSLAGITVSGTVALEGSLDGVNYVEIADTNTTIALTDSAQKILYNVISPMYRYMRVAFDITGGLSSTTAKMTIIEGGM